MTVKEKNIEDCIKELIVWVNSRPYSNSIGATCFRNWDYYGKQNNEKTYRDIHCYIGDLVGNIKFKNSREFSKKDEYLFEHITPILLKYDIDTISIGMVMYKRKNNKYIFQAP